MENKLNSITRRATIRSLAGGSLLLPGMLSELMAEQSPSDPLAPRNPHFAPKAKRLIFLYMSGGVSHVDSFDYKPKLIADDGKEAKEGKFLIRPKWEFKQYGQSGMHVSELFPKVATCVDDLCMIHSMRNDHTNHYEATLGVHTGSVTFARPSIGSWLTYGLGTFNRNLPAFVVIAPQMPYAGDQVWSANFLPAAYQGTRILPGDDPIPNLKRYAPTGDVQELQLGLLDYFNRRHLARHESDSTLAARIRSFETAFGMQQEAPEVFDLSKETDATLSSYGIERGNTEGFGWQCLIARRLSERGVRFVELIDVGSSNNWDSHADMQTHVPRARNVDQPIAALINDLKARGMLEDTLLVWTTEFGRTPFNTRRDAKGREHHHPAYTSWITGAGVKRGYIHGSTDEYGIEIAQDQVHVHDFHATILHLMGIDHLRLTYRYAGRDFRLTDVAGNVVKQILV